MSKYILPLCLCAAVVCGHAVESETPASDDGSSADQSSVAMQLVLPDWQRSLQRWQGSPFAAIIAEVEKSGLADQYAQMKTQVFTTCEDELMIDPLPLLDHAQRFVLTLRGQKDDDQPRVHAALAMAGDQAQKLFDQMKEMAGAVVSDDGTSIFSEGGATSIAGDTLTYLSEDMDEAPAYDSLIATAGEADGYLELDAVLPANDPEAVMVSKWLSILRTDEGSGFSMTQRLSMGPKGLTVRSAFPGCDMNICGMPIDDAVFAPLPATTLVLIAGGLDGPRLVERITAAEATIEDLTPQLQEQDAKLEQMGLPPLKTILASLTGTAYFAVTPSVPFPAMTLALPGSEEMDQVMNVVAGMAQVDLSAAREQSVAIKVPNQQMPVIPYARRTDSHWLISTDPMLLGNIVGGTPGGFTDSTLAADLHPEDGQSLFTIAINPQQTATTANAFLPMLAMGMSEEEKGTLTDGQALVTAITPLLPPMDMRLVSVGAHTELRSRNLGALWVLAGAATLLSRQDPGPGPIEAIPDEPVEETSDSSTAPAEDASGK